MNEIEFIRQIHCYLLITLHVASKYVSLGNTAWYMLMMQNNHDINTKRFFLKSIE